MGVGQVWSVNSLGGFYYSLNLSKELRMGVKATSKFRQFADIRDAFGKVTRSGQTFTWDTVPMMTRASRALTETNTIPQGQHTVLQGTLTMNERGFSVPYTEFLESMSQFNVRQPIMKVLKYDASVDLDCLAWEQFNNTPLRMMASASADAASLTTDSIPAGASMTASVAMSTTNFKSVVDTMKGRNIPYYTESDYFAIARPLQLRGLKNTLEGLSQYSDRGFGMIMNGEVGRSYENVRIVEQTTIPAGGAYDARYGTGTYNPFTDTPDAWNTPSGAPGTTDWMFIFGADTVCEAIHTPVEIRSKIPDDYGRSKGIAWYGLMGYGITHTNVTQARIVKWDSAV